MELVYILIAIVAFAIILCLMFISQRKGKQTSKSSRIATIALSFVLVGLIFGKADGWLGYSLMGAGVILALIDLVKSVKK